MIGRARAGWRQALVVVLLSVLAPAPIRAAVQRDDTPQITMVIADPQHLQVRYGVDAVQQVVRSVDGGRSWVAILSPGDPEAPDPSTLGACLPANYASVTFLVYTGGRLYAGTDGTVGDVQDNDCGNASGGIFASLGGTSPFVPLSRGLPAGTNARGAGPAWGVRALIPDPVNPATLYAITDPTFHGGSASAATAYRTDPGVYRTTDGGVQWDPAFAGIATTPCAAGLCRDPGGLAVDPLRPQTLLYATDSGFYRSDDRGTHWALQATLAGRPGAHFITRISPYQEGVAYVATGSAAYRTADVGVHLARLTDSRVPDPSRIADIQFVPGSPAAVAFLLDSGVTVAIANGSALRVVGAALPGATAAPATAIPATATSPSATSTPAMPRPTPRPAAASPITPIAGIAPRRILLGATTWPMPGHDPQQSFADPLESITLSSVASLHLRWQRASAVPAISVGATVYARSTDAGRIIALSGVTGTVLHRFLSTGVLTIAYAHHLLYFNRGSEIRFVDPVTAAWHHTVVDRRGTRLAAFNSVVVGDTLGFTGVSASGSRLPRYYAFDPLTGQTLWWRPAVSSSTPCLVGDTLYISVGTRLGSGDSYLLDARTGRVRRVLRGLGTAQWHAAGGRVYAAVLRGTIAALHPFINAYDGQGRLRWTADGVLFGAALPDRLVAVAPGVVDALDARDGRRLWQAGVQGLQPGAYNSGIAMAGNLIFAQASDGRITVLEAASGRQVQVLRPPFAASGADNLVLGDGEVFESVVTRDGTSVLLAFGL